MSSILASLRSTSKGQLSYSKNLDTGKLKNDLDYLSSPPLAFGHNGKDSSSNDDSFVGDSSFKCQDSNKCNSSTESPVGLRYCKSISFALSELDEIEKSDSMKEDGLDTSLPVLSEQSEISSSQQKKHASSCPVSPQFGITVSAIQEEEAMWDSFAELRLLKRTTQYADHERALLYLMKAKEEEMDSKIQRKIEIKDNLVKQKQDECVAATQSKLQRLKADHQEHQKKIHTKQQEIARQIEKLQEDERKRQEREQARVNELITLLGEVQTNRNNFVQILDSCALKDKLPDIVEKYRVMLDKVCANFSQKLAAGSPKSVTDEVLIKAKEHSDKSLQAVAFLKKQISDTEEKKKGDDKHREEQRKQKEQETKLAEEVAQDLRVQSLAYVLKEYDSKATLLSEVNKTVQAFIANVNMKKFRFDLQRAVNTPINAISPVSGSHLRDKLKRLHSLLTGQLVTMDNKQVSLNNSQEGKVFCENLVAKMLVKKGEEQVTSNHESAFAIASVVLGLWAEIPIVGNLFLAHLQSACPYILPLYNTRKDGQSTEDYHRSLGYKVNDDKSIEEQDKFLHRMSGLMHLYCACIVSTPPKGADTPHPIDINQSWMWLARTINMEPQPDITASMIYDVLFVTGHFLFREYKMQFVKLLHILYRQYLPKLKSVSVTKSTVGRLEIFLESVLQNGGRIAPPKGLLPAQFFLS